jgi:hypothetical protein
MPKICKNPYEELEDVGDDSFSVSSAGLLLVKGRGRCLKERKSSEGKETPQTRRRSLSKGDHGPLTTTLSSSLLSLRTGSKASEPTPHSKRNGLSVLRQRNRSESRSGSPTSDTGSRRRTRQGAGDDASVDVPYHAPFAQLNLSNADEKEIVIGWVRNSHTSEVRPHSKRSAHHRPPLHKPPRVDSDPKNHNLSGISKDRRSGQENGKAIDLDESTRRLPRSQKMDLRRKLKADCLNVSSEMEIHWHRNGPSMRSISLVEPSSDSTMRSYIPAHLRVYQGKTVITNTTGNRQNVKPERQHITPEGSVGERKSKGIIPDGVAITEIIKNSPAVGCQVKKARDSGKKVPSKVGSNIQLSMDTSGSLRNERNQLLVKDMKEEANGLDEVNRGTLMDKRGRRETKNRMRRNPSASPRRQDDEQIFSWRRIRETLETRGPQHEKLCSHLSQSRPKATATADRAGADQSKRNRSFDASRQRRQPRRNRSFDGTTIHVETPR